ncbi:MAG: MoaD/ThiS family protein, partial [Blastocatellia bacterium]
MPVKILIPTALRGFAGGQDAVPVQGSTVSSALDSLVVEHPALKKHLYNEEGKLRSFVNVYLNEEDIRYLEKDSTPLKDGDVLSIVPSIAGGSTATEPAETVELENDEILRYSRHLIMPEVGMEGQKKLKAAKVLTIGAG